MAATVLIHSGTKGDPKGSINGSETTNVPNRTRFQLGYLWFRERSHGGDSDIQGLLHIL